jgi:tRNA(Ile)-lysidine synthase
VEALASQMTKPRKSGSSSGKPLVTAKYPPPLSAFARKLASVWRQLKTDDCYETVVVAVSGGADSVALLLALDELVRAKKIKVKILVAHLNHKLRGPASEADARRVRSLAKELGHQVVVRSLDVAKRAGKSKDNLEQAARLTRYEFLVRVARANKARLVLTAHTMNDQAETIVLNLIRGSGGVGLRGIEPVRPITPKSDIVLARPLLDWARRQDTESYCRKRSVAFRNDQMNSDPAFSRVRVRNEVLPLLEQFNPKFVETVVRSAEILRADNQALDSAAQRLVEVASQAEIRSNGLRADVLRIAAPALRRRAFRLWLGEHRGDLRRIEHPHLLAIEKLLLSPKSGRVIELPGGAAVFRQDGALHYRPPRTAK